MTMDALLLFSDAQAVTATAASTSSIDLGPLVAPNLLGNLIRDIGVGEETWLVVSVVTAMTDAGSDSTIAVSWETDADSAFGSVVTLFTLPVFAALSAVGTERIIALPPAEYERYNQLRYTTANGNLTTGSFTARIVKDIQKWRAYADSIVIS